MRPKNFNFWYFFGVLAMLVLVNQLLTGIWLTMSYNPSAEGALCLGRIHHVRDVEWGLVAALRAFDRCFGLLRW